VRAGWDAEMYSPLPAVSSNGSGSSSPTSVVQSSTTMSSEDVGNQERSPVSALPLTAKLARTHMVSSSPSGLVTVTGGKWTTYRQMAEDTVDAAIRETSVGVAVGAGEDVLLHARPCITRNLPLFGSRHWRPSDPVALAQSYHIAPALADRLSHTYGDRAGALLAEAATSSPPFAPLCSPPPAPRGAKPGNMSSESPGPVPTSPTYLQAEVVRAVQCEYAVTATDVLARRTRLAFLDAQAARLAVPAVVDIMAPLLGWDAARRKREITEANDFLQSFDAPSLGCVVCPP